MQSIYPNKDMRENYLKTLEFRYPEWIPCSVGFSPLSWKLHRNKLEEVIARHPRIFGSYEGQRSIERIDRARAPRDRFDRYADFDVMPPVYREGERYVDNWGCTWYNVKGGLEGQVVKHPLEDWGALEGYAAPDPLVKWERGDDVKDWGQIKRAMADRKGMGLLTVGDGERLFDRLYFLRGFTNLMKDIVSDDPHLPRLISVLEEHEMTLIDRWLEIGVDAIGFHTDIGTQNGLMINPVKFRKHIKPLFKKLFRRCRDANTHVCLSSDGRLLDIVDDLIECGVSVHDPQLRANTLEGIANAYKGKMCVDLDLDRQMFEFCKPGDIRRQVKESVEKLYLPEGGLMMSGSIYGAVPLENIEALCGSMEEFCIGRR